MIEGERAGGPSKGKQTVRCTLMLLIVLVKAALAVLVFSSKTVLMARRERIGAAVERQQKRHIGTI